MSINEELTEITKIKRKEGEDEQAFLRRLFGKANTLSEADWEKLSEPAQKWVNAAGDALEAKPKQTIPSLGGENGAAGAPASAKAKDKAKDKKGVAAKAVGAEKGEKAPDKKAVAKDKAAPAKPDKAAAGGRGRPASIDGKAKIKVLKENPHRKGSKDHDRFKQYKDGMTVDKAIEKGLRRTDINWHQSKGYIEIEKPA